VIKKKLDREDVKMDNINIWLLKLHEAIDSDVNLDPLAHEELESIIYGNISNYLERFFDYPYYENYNVDIPSN